METWLRWKADTMCHRVGKKTHKLKSSHKHFTAAQYYAWLGKGGKQRGKQVVGTDLLKHLHPFTDLVYTEVSTGS